MVTKKEVMSALRECYDPEIPVNIVDLGMIYGVDVRGSKVNVKMTLTSPHCPLHGMITEDVKNKLLAIKGVKEANVELVWEPPWNPGMINKEAKKKLGMV